MRAALCSNNLSQTVATGVHMGVCMHKEHIAARPWDLGASRAAGIFNLRSTIAFMSCSALISCTAILKKDMAFHITSQSIH